MYWAALLLSIVALAGSGAAYLLKARVYSPLPLALAGYGVVLLKMVLLDTHESSASIDEACLLYSIGAAVLLGSIFVAESLVPRRGLSGWSTWRSRFAEFEEPHAHWAGWAGISSLGLLLASRWGNLDLSWSEARSEFGFLVTLAIMLMLVAASGVVTAYRQRKWWFVVAGALAMAVGFVVVGSRAAILTGVAFFVWLSLAEAAGLNGRVRTLLVVGVAAFAVHVGLRFVRSFGLVGLVAALSDGNLIDLFSSSSIAEDISGGEGDIADYLIFAVHSARVHDYGWLTSVVRVLLLWVPSSYLGLPKPMDVTYQLWAEGFSAGLFDEKEGMAVLQQSYMSGLYGSLHPTLFGEVFLAGLWTSLFLSTVFVGIVCVFIDRMLERVNGLCSVLVLGPVLVGMLMIARGNSVIGFGYFFYIAGLVLTVQHLNRWVIGFVKYGLGATRRGNGFRQGRGS